MSMALDNSRVTTPSHEGRDVMAGQTIPVPALDPQRRLTVARARDSAEKIR
jgi:hypothetical protein